MNSGTLPNDPRLDALRQWLFECFSGRSFELAPASADASFRRYFRIFEGTNTWIAMDAPPPQEDVRPFVKIAQALQAAGLNVPLIHAQDTARGFLLLSDLGSTHYLAALNAGVAASSLYPAAAAALLKMQTSSNLLVGLQRYDAEVFAREVALFPEWFVARHLQLPLNEALGELLKRVLHRVDLAVGQQPYVFVHRDYHCRNLMVCGEATPGILDFQDAIEGPLTYDLVSLYKDCYWRWPRSQVTAWVEDYRRRAAATGLAVSDTASFLHSFDLMGLQRHLKVLGIFARLWYRDGKKNYLNDLPMVLDYVLEVARLYPELSDLDRYLTDHVLPGFEAAQARALA